MGNAAVGDFTRDSINLTVAYAGAAGPFDWTFRRMILHYANLCVVAGGVSLFVIGSELRGLEILRGPTWTNTRRPGRFGQCDLGLSNGGPVERPRPRRPVNVRQRGAHEDSARSQEPHYLFGRLVELDGMAACRGKRAVAASRSTLGQSEHRFRELRQLHAPDRLDDRLRRFGRGELERATVQRDLAAWSDPAELDWV